MYFRPPPFALGFFLSILSGLEPLMAAPTAVPTFHCMSLYWNPSGASGSTACHVRYAKQSEPTNFHTAQDLFYDSAKSRYSGSVVNLEPGTSYVFELTKEPSNVETVTFSTWSENFPIKKRIVLPATVSATYLITQGGNASDGYVIYDGTPNSTVIDADPNGGSESNAADYCVEIRASHVILRGVLARNAKKHGIYLNSNLHDVVIEGCDITKWGRKNAWAGKTVRVAYKNYITGEVETSTETRTVLANLGVQLDSGIRGKGSTMERIIIQGNKIHHPRYNSNNWTQPSGDYFAHNAAQSISDFHPEGPKAIVLYEPGVDVPTKANHVIRYNEIYGDSDHRFNDAVFESYGNIPNAVDCPCDTDIYGNLIADVVDDIMETERAISNVRVFGNYFTNISKGVSFYQSESSGGPFYLFRNVFDVVQQTSRPGFSYSVVGTDLRAQIMKRPFMPTGGMLVPHATSRLFSYHNTYLAPSDQGFTFMWGNDIPNMAPLALTGALVSRNNIYKTSANWPTVSGTGLPAPNAPMMTYQSGGVTSGPTPCDGDVYNGNVESAATAAFGPNCHQGLAIYKSGHGFGSGGKYQLQSGSPGSDGGLVLPNFNDGYTGTAPDSGAQEDGSHDIIFGTANWTPSAVPPPTAGISIFTAVADARVLSSLQ